MTPEEISKKLMTLTTQDNNKPAQGIVETAYENGSTDNLTAIVIRLHRSHKAHKHKSQ